MKPLTHKKQVTSCGACIYRVNDAGNVEILLIKPFGDRGTWGVPKGHLESGESLTQCAIREAREEAGVDVLLEERLSVVMTTNKREHKNVHVWLAQQSCDTVPAPNDPDGEVVDVRWFAEGTLPPVHRYQRSLIEEALCLIHAKLGES